MREQLSDLLIALLQTNPSQADLDSLSRHCSLAVVTNRYARHLEGKYYTTTGYVGDDTANPPLISLFVPGEIIRVLDKDANVVERLLRTAILKMTLK